MGFNVIVKKKKWRKGLKVTLICMLNVSITFLYKFLFIYLFIYLFFFYFTAERTEIFIDGLFWITTLFFFLYYRESLKNIRIAVEEIAWKSLTDLNTPFCQILRITAKINGQENSEVRRTFFELIDKLTIGEHIVPYSDPIAGTVNWNHFKEIK